MNTKLPFYFAKSHGLYIESMDEEKMRVAHLNTLSGETFLELQRCYSQHIELKAVNESEFASGLASVYETTTDLAMEAVEGAADLQSLIENLPTAEELLENEDDAPVIKLLNAVLTQAIREKASDIHVEIFEERLVIRFRVDGVLQEILEPPRLLAPLLTSRLKVMAKLDIAEKRLPQDGRIALRVAGRAIDVRASTIPTHYGERIVLRLLDKQNIPLNLSVLGMNDKHLQQMRALIQKPHGIILVTGPTGSGKTTTLYASLTELNDISRNILTVEDPIEYYLTGIGQTQVNPKVEMTFARGLRAILRQDPDVVMVGEIRDLETAKMAVQASLTGHLVLSTLHTNTAVGAIARLRDMGIEPFLLSSTLTGVIAQRLVRVLCNHCKITVTNETEVQYKAVGCDRCRHSGYQGRIGIYEIITVDDVLRRMIHENQSEQTMENYVRQQSPDIQQSGWQRVLDGTTSCAELLRVTSRDK